ncbi:lipid A export permease/ATP-binding protein MsbA [Psychrosphaera saromensis]|uniref:Lipid A export permease/ATP-binding protein MsbA n=1 Tax=Psychrosphaera saromensis TaxID=716813 RepID=A0A2S7V049_9GAMM|nr:lipid A export permease/ATP-binding protein MsbA [Psychrosphaera saromensis]
MVKEPKTFKRLLQYVKPFKFIFAFAIIGMVINASIDALFISKIQTFIDEGITGQSSKVLAYAPIFVIVVFVLRGLSNFMATFGLGSVGSNVVMNMRQELYEKIMSLPVSFHDANSTGSLISKITYDTEQLENACSKALLVMVREGAFVIGLMTIMFYHSWQLSIAILVLVPFVAIVVTYVTKRFRVISKRIQQAMGHVTRQSEQMISGHKVILAFGGQDKEKTEFLKINNNNRQQKMKMVSTSVLSVSTIQIIASFALASVLYMASSPEMLNTLTPGTFTVVITAMMTLLRPLKQLTTVNSEFQRGITAARSVFEVLDEESESNTGTVVKESVKGKVVFKDLDFAYPNSEVQVIKNLNLEIEAGTTVALVGRSGSGKTTISNFIPRYYYPQSGHVEIDGVDINDFELSNLRSHIALVSQHVTLFNDSIAANIAYGDKKVTREEIEQAAELAHVTEFANNMEFGLDTEVGENGVLLSGGQRQRIAIARALLRNAPILIMDEATSALDTESERAIQDALNKLMKNRTSLVIAHRLSTIENADKIIVMDQGEILEQGSHAELLEKKGAYAALHQLQFSES